jgi:peptidoglycan/LPS O-acetylase OafA/YrhL
VIGVRSRQVRITATVLLVLTVVTGACVVLDVRGDFRLPLTLLFVLFAPGWAIANYLRMDRPSLVWSVSAAVGGSLAIITAQIMVTTGRWHPVGALLLVCALTVVLLVHHLVRRIEESVEESTR